MSVVHPRTPDGRYFVVRGRLWRLSNPNLTPEARQSLTLELMEARRAVRDARGDPKRLAAARSRVHVSKCALGERGAVWWSGDPRDFNRCLVGASPYSAWYEAFIQDVPTTQIFDDTSIEQTLISILRNRDALASCCPSDVARALAPDDEKIWRSMMPRVMDVLAGLVDRHRVRVTRGRRVLRVDEFRGGPIRIRRGERFD